MPFNMLKPGSKRKRRYRDPNKPARAAVSTLIVSTPSKAATKRGRPPVPYDALSKEGRRKRDYRAGLAESHVPQLLLPLLEAAAELAAADAERQQEERSQREAARRMHALERQLGVRNPDANGPAALILRAAARVDGEDECGIASALCDSTPRSMRCCGHACCAACLCEWLRRNGQETDVGYGDADYYAAVDGESEMRACRGQYRGRVIRVPMDTHRCPWCHARVESVRRALS